VEIQEHRQGAVTVLRPVGPLCADDADVFRARCAEAATRTLGRLVVDASAVPYTDSRGLEVLLELSETLGEAGQSLKLCAATDTVREALELTELSHLFEHYEDVTSGVRSFL
jgi:anti-anti-sigma factor